MKLVKFIITLWTYIMNYIMCLIHNLNIHLTVTFCTSSLEKLEWLIWLFNYLFAGYAPVSVYNDISFMTGCEGRLLKLFTCKGKAHLLNEPFMHHPV